MQIKSYSSLCSKSQKSQSKQEALQWSLHLNVQVLLNSVFYFPSVVSDCLEIAQCHRWTRKVLHEEEEVGIPSSYFDHLEWRSRVEDQ